MEGCNVKQDARASNKAIQRPTSSWKDPGGKFSPQKKTCTLNLVSLKKPTAMV